MSVPEHKRDVSVSSTHLYCSKYFSEGMMFDYHNKTRMDDGSPTGFLLVVVRKISSHELHSCADLVSEICLTS